MHLLCQREREAIRDQQKKKIYNFAYKKELRNWDNTAAAS